MNEELLKLLQENTLSISMVFVRHYYQIGLSNEEFLLFSLYSQQHLEIGEIASIMGKQEQEILNMFESLSARQLVLIEYPTSSNGKADIYYSFYPVYQKLVRLLQEKKEVEQTSQTQQVIVSVFELFEQTWAKALSSFEMEYIQKWVTEDGYTYETIKAALKEAVVSNVRQMKYIDSILLTWEKNKQISSKVANENTNLENEFNDVSLLSTNWLEG